MGPGRIRGPRSPDAFSFGAVDWARLLALTLHGAPRRNDARNDVQTPNEIHAEQRSTRSPITELRDGLALREALRGADRCSAEEQRRSSRDSYGVFPKRSTDSLSAVMYKRRTRSMRSTASGSEPMWAHRSDPPRAAAVGPVVGRWVRGGSVAHGVRMRSHSAPWTGRGSSLSHSTEHLARRSLRGSRPRILQVASGLAGCDGLRPAWPSGSDSSA